MTRKTRIHIPPRLLVCDARAGQRAEPGHEDRYRAAVDADMSAGPYDCSLTLDREPGRLDDHNSALKADRHRERPFTGIGVLCAPPPQLQRSSFR